MNNIGSGAHFLLEKSCFLFPPLLVYFLNGKWDWPASLQILCSSIKISRTFLLRELTLFDAHANLNERTTKTTPKKTHNVRLCHRIRANLYGL